MSDSEKEDLFLTCYQPTADECRWGRLIHLTFLGGWLVGPAMIGAAHGQNSPYIADQAREALNFHFAMLISVAVCLMTCVMAPFALFFLLYGAGNAWMASVSAHGGHWYRYPFIFRALPQ